MLVRWRLEHGTLCNVDTSRNLESLLTLWNDGQLEENGMLKSEWERGSRR